jgi:hypothetical protein
LNESYFNADKRIFDVLSKESMPKPSIVAEDSGLRKECKRRQIIKSSLLIAAENFARFYAVTVNVSPLTVTAYC